MNKFGKRGEEDFETICEVIEKMVEQAPTLTSILLSDSLRTDMMLMDPLVRQQ